MRKYVSSLISNSVLCQCHNYSLNALVLENQPLGTVVLRVQAHDADTGVNGEVRYGIMQRDGASPGFTIDPNTGKSGICKVVCFLTLLCWISH